MDYLLHHFVIFELSRGYARKGGCVSAKKTLKTPICFGRICIGRSLYSVIFYLHVFQKVVTFFCSVFSVKRAIFIILLWIGKKKQNKTKQKTNKQTNN